MHTNPASFSPDLIAKIVRCVEDAVGDDIQADVQRNDLQTQNSVPSRIWDLLNTNIIKTLGTEDCIVIKTHRGPWEMLVVFEKSSQCIITFMREKRFAELRKRQRQRHQMHYIDMLARQFNKDLLANQQQLSFIPCKVSDEGKLAEFVQALLLDLGSDIDIVRHHVLVLFDTVGYQLTSIRSVMVTPSLDIAQGSEQDWSKYIRADESAIVEKLTNPTAPENQPSRGLSLTAKAMARKKDKPQRKNAEVSDQEEN